MHQRWHDLLFAHWSLPPASLRPMLPPFLELDTYHGEAWVGVIPFWMSNVRPRCVPPLPGLSRFLELNVRTYVRHNGKPGVYFFSLDASNGLAVALARGLFHLPYFRADMHMTGGTWPGSQQWFGKCSADWIHYTSRRTDLRGAPADLAIRYRPSAPPLPVSAPGSLPHWLTARYSLFTTSPRGDLFCGEIHHEPWPLQPARAEIEVNTMAAAAGIPLPGAPPLLHFSRRIDVRIWALQRTASPSRSR